MQALTPGRKLALALVPALCATGLVALIAESASAETVQCTVGGAGTASCEYSNPDEIGVFTVPAGVTSIHVTARGGAGSDGAAIHPPDPSRPAGKGGAGGEVSRNVTVQPGQVLHVLIGEGGEDPEQGCTPEPPAGGSSGDTSEGRGGNGADSGAGYCTGGAGGGGTFLMKQEELPDSSTPLVAAGGGGGGGGGRTAMSPAADGNDGGRGGPVAEPGQGPDGEVGISSNSNGLNGTTGGGGGGGGAIGSGGGSAGGGGAGGCGRPESCDAGTYMSPTTVPATYRVAALNGSMTIQYATPPPSDGPGNGQPPPDVPTDPNPNGAGHSSSNDPNPNTNPHSDPKPLPGMAPNTDTALCKPEKKICTVSVSGSESSFRIDAEDGKDTAVLFAGMNGNWRPASVEASGRPNCPGYTERNSEWVQFGFFQPERGKTWHKTGYLTQRQKMKKAAAAAMAQKLQVCFAAPYKFPTRPGYRLGTQGPDRVGVLAECGTVRGKVPCVTARDILKVKGGWVVRVTFKVPANAKDPKALG